MAAAGGAGGGGAGFAACCLPVVEARALRGGEGVSGLWGPGGAGCAAAGAGGEDPGCWRSEAAWPGLAGAAALVELFPQSNGRFLPAKVPPPRPGRPAQAAGKDGLLRWFPAGGASRRRCGRVPGPAGLSILGVLGCTGHGWKGRTAAAGGAQ